jgi:hypothetical protein
LTAATTLTKIQIVRGVLGARLTSNTKHFVYAKHFLHEALGILSKAHVNRGRCNAPGLRKPR